MASELELRSCGRAGCRWPAAASLSFRYETREVWLIDLAPEPHPTLYDLCPHHADALTVPRGWDRVDEREPRAAVREPSGHDLEVRARARVDAEPVRVGGGSRYAALAEELPRLAEQYGTGPGAGAGPQPAGGAAASHARPPGGTAGEGHPPPGGAAAESHAPAPVPSRDLAPLPLGEPAAPATPPPGATPRRADDPAPPAEGRARNHPGQLAIPVDAPVRPDQAIVVPIQAAGGRRRSPPSA